MYQLFAFTDIQVKFVELDLVDGGRRIDHHVAALVVLREGNVIPDGIASAEQCAYPVEAECKTSVRWSAELEGIDDEAELVCGLFLADAENFEHPLLQ